jgi:subtilisin family serine protease
MKKLPLLSRVLFTNLLILSLLFTSKSVANIPINKNIPNQSSGISPGERPPVDFSKVSDEYLEPGKIYVKFRSAMAKSLDPGLITTKAGETVSIGISGVDELNRQFGVYLIKSMLYELYQLPEKTLFRADRHRDRGLHLWYEIGLDSNADVLAAAEAYSNLPEVEIAEPVFRKMLIEPVSSQEITAADLGSDKTSPSDQLYGLQWGFKNTGQSIRGNYGLAGADIRAEAAWATVQGNPDIIVAVIDQGFEYDHPDLQANVWPGIGPEGTNTTAGNHGTHVAGTVAAVSNNGIGVAGTAGGNGGSNSGVKVMSLDIFNGTHGMNKLQLNVYAADHGAVITQNSWGYALEGVYNQADLDGIDYFNAHGGGGILDGGLTIFAAGNSNSSGKWYPAYYSGAMAIASTNNLDQKSGFSNFGNWIDLAAPGTDIASTAAGSYYWMSGTSMACPHVSGVAALVLSYVPGKMTNQQLWNLLVSTADNIDTHNPDHAGLLGSGRLNAQKAIEAASAFTGGTHPTTYYTITSSASPGGAISPSGNIQVKEGHNQFFSIAANEGYMITDVLVNGFSIGAVSSHSFTNVRDNHTIHAEFTEDTGVSYTIKASSGKGGSISPTGDISVRQGSSQGFTITPANGYYILDVAVDNVSVGAVSSHTFSNVSADHTIRAAFRQLPDESYTITASAGTNGSISPSGTITLTTMQEAASRSPLPPARDTRSPMWPWTTRALAQWQVIRSPM